MVVNFGADDEGDGIRLVQEKLLAALVVQLICVLLEAYHLLGQAIEAGGVAAERAQKRNRLHHQLGGLNDDLAHLRHGLLEIAQLEQGNDLGCLVHLIDCVVH
jgi:hypothetical protein